MIVRHNFPFCEPDFAGCEAAQIEFKTVIEAPRVYRSLEHWLCMSASHGGRTPKPRHSYLIARIPGMEIHG